jgi:predicted cation transporter
MRLIWKKFDSTFDPVLTLVGIGFALGGLYGIALLRHALRHPIVLIVAVIPALLGVMGVLIVVREVQLFRDR